jgi:hypothetical protein
MLPPLLNTLGFRCNNTAYRPVMDAMKLLKKYADVDGKTRFYDAGDEVPMDGVVRKDWREAVVDDKGKVERIPYELRVLVAAGRGPPRDLRRGCGPLAKPGGRPARRLRGHPCRALRRDPPAAEPEGVHRGPEEAHDCGPGTS